MEAALAWVPYEKKHEVDACEKGMDGLESHFAVCRNHALDRGFSGADLSAR